VASGAKNATKLSMSFFAKASLAATFRCLISSQREAAEVREECIQPVDVEYLISFVRGGLIKTPMTDR
jgi:hypothetical protein